MKLKASDLLCWYIFFEDTSIIFNFLINGKRHRTHYKLNVNVCTVNCTWGYSKSYKYHRDYCRTMGFVATAIHVIHSKHTVNQEL